MLRPDNSVSIYKKAGYTIVFDPDVFDRPSAFARLYDDRTKTPLDCSIVEVYYVL